MKDEIILSLDPGKNKCGLAALKNKEILFRAVCPRNELAEQLQRLISELKPSTLLIGEGTESKAIQREIDQMELKLHIFHVPEKNTTMEARQLYWKLNPPKGLWRLFPTSLRYPPEPFDDLAAVIIARRFSEEH
jgi:RNase H-fold protein (predicted Holliday junction resolvase)